MKRIILTNTGHKNRMETDPFDNGWHYRYACMGLKHFFVSKFLMEEMGFEMWDNWNHDKKRHEPVRMRQLEPGGVEIIVLFEQLHNVNIDKFMKFLKLYPDAKLVLFPIIDFRRWDDCKDKLRPLIERVDLLLDWQKHYWKPEGWFESVFPEYADKHIFFPHCVSPYDNWMQVEFNEKPLERCLFSGRVGGRYLIRNAFLKAVLKDEELNRVVDMCMHPKGVSILDFYKKCSKHYFELSFINEQRIIKDDYIKLLNSYLCGMTCGTKFHHLIGKCFEIPASGSLLVCDSFPDLDLAGFVPHVHYVPVTEDTVASTVKHICNNPLAYEGIRKAGYEFVRKEHNLKKRCEQLRGYIEGVLNG